MLLSIRSQAETHCCIKHPCQLSPPKQTQGLFSESEPLLWPLITRRTVNNLQLSQSPAPTCHRLMLQPHLERPEISTGFIENKNVFYLNQCSWPWFAEQHTRVDRAKHRSPAPSLRGVTRCHKEPAFALHHPSHIPLQSDTEAAWHLQSLISQ